MAGFSPTLWQFIERIQLVLLCLATFQLRWLYLALRLILSDPLTLLIVLIFVHLWRVNFIKLLKLLLGQRFGSFIVIPSIDDCLIRLLLYALINCGAPSWAIDRLLLGLGCLFGTVDLDSFPNLGCLNALWWLFALFCVRLGTLRSWSAPLIRSASHIYTKPSRHLSVFVCLLRN